MAQGRCLQTLTLTRRAMSLFSFKTPPPPPPPPLPNNLIPSKPCPVDPALFRPSFHLPRLFSSSANSADDMEAEAASIGYKVVGPLQLSDRIFKPYEPVFAVVQIGSHQFKVSNGDSIFAERLKFCDVNDKLVLNRVLMLGSSTQTIVGRPIVPDAAVYAVVEEHALDAKVIIFKKKRRKNYRRTKGHRQELTQLRITDIQGIEKPEKTAAPIKTAVKKQEKVAVTAKYD